MQFDANEYNHLMQTIIVLRMQLLQILRRNREDTLKDRLELKEIPEACRLDDT